ncbi:uncharacterized protein LOC126898084 [Daktulosphaira vitifoliae]|uniref:uncharacterized protein LOC126898084 n=1 Tax=Daktulosphaira vitifoliae TaxID=58002 RepID=UPI0021AAF340|nr:uncharacterized protein LOC126898084 [Daktulosphaira vitifoliae]
MNSKVLESVKKILNFTVKRGGFDRVFDKVKIISAGNGKCMAEMVVEKDHTNGYGTLHGGFTASAVDLFSSLAVSTHPKVVEDIDSIPRSGVSVDLHISYLASAKIGEEIVINADTIKLGKHLAYLEVIMSKKADNVIIAKGSHTKFVKEIFIKYFFKSNIGFSLIIIDNYYSSIIIMNYSNTFESVKKLFNQLVKSDGYYKNFDKVRLVSAGNGKCVAEMVIHKHHSNIHGTLHGGFIASALDFFSSLALFTHPKIADTINSKPKFCVSVDIHVSYMASAKIGDEIVIEAQTIKCGRNIAYLEVILSKKCVNEVIAKGSHTLYIIQSKI